MLILHYWPFILGPGAVEILAMAFTLDLIIGDPEKLFHPVRLIGRAITSGEPLARNLPVGEKAQGAVLVIVLTSGVFLAVDLGVKISGHISGLLQWFISAILLYYGLSLKCLGGEAMSVKKALFKGDIEAGRQSVSRLVGRDTDSLDTTGVTMAAIETIAENLVDGVLSPFFFGALGGPALCMSYKAINTLDSMIGYKTKQYLEFGTWGARLDDIANYIPARLSVAVISLASPLVGGNKPWYVWRVVLSDGQKHSSPNSGLPEAAFAAALGLRLPGPSCYNGKLVDLPIIHTDGREPVIQDIDDAVKLLCISSFLFVGVALLLGIIIRDWN
jgi:adenosylcobinamide-phosphate synthase